MLSSGSVPVSGRGDKFSGPASDIATVQPRTAVAAPAPAAPVVQTKPAYDKWYHQPAIPWFTDWIDKNRKLLFAIAVLPFLLTFNGRWRLGLDSALYRGLGHSLALGRGYQFGDFATRQAYPGLPVVLAVFEKVFGQMTFRPWPVLLLMVALSIATLLLVYRLIGMHFPRWVAVSVTFLLAINSQFVILTTEVMTDVPFLFGLVTALYGWELLRRAETDEGENRARGRWTGIAIQCFGLTVAAAMRPTFWIVAAAWGIVALWGLVRGPYRRFSAICLLTLLAVWGAMIMVDPRTGKGLHFSPLSGGYEEEAMDALQTATQHLDPETRLGNLSHRLAENAPLLVNKHLAASFFGQPMPKIFAAIVFTILFVSPLFILRRRPLWALLVPLTIGVTFVLSTEPRYYLMIMPVLLLGWVLAWRSVSVRLPGGYGDLLLAIALVGLAVDNVSKVIPLVRDQHAAPLWASDATFYQKYRGGEFPRVIELARVVRERTSPQDKTIAPSPSIVAFLSDRQVLRERELLPLKKGIRSYPAHVKTMNPTYLVLPWQMYRDKDPELARLIQRRVLVPGKKVQSHIAGQMTLARARVVVRSGDWSKGAAPKTAKASAKGSLNKKWVPPARKAAKLRAKQRMAAAAHAGTPGAAPVKKKKRLSVPPPTPGTHAPLAPMTTPPRLPATRPAALAPPSPPDAPAGYGSGAIATAAWRSSAC